MGDVFGLCAGRQIGVGLAKELRISIPPPLCLCMQILFGKCLLRIERKHEQRSINRERLVLSPNRTAQFTGSF